VGVILFFGVTIGFVAALVATFLLAVRFVGAMMPRDDDAAAARRTIRKGAVAGGLIAFVPALLLATVIGATLGGTYGGALGDAAGARDSGSLAGVALGVFAVATILLCLSVALGAGIGRWLAGRATAED